MGLNNPGTYVLPGDTQPTSLVVGGAADFAGSPPNGSLTTLNNSYAKIGDLTNADVLPSGGVTSIVPNGGDTNTRPAVLVNTSQPASSVGGESGFDFASLFATYRGISADMFSCPSGDAAWLVINVVVDGDYTFTPPNVSWQGNGPSRHVLWNVTTSGTITLPPGSPTVWGTLYAPDAALVDLSSSNIAARSTTPRSRTP